MFKRTGIMALQKKVLEKRVKGVGSCGKGEVIMGGGTKSVFQIPVGKVKRSARENSGKTFIIEASASKVGMGNTQDSRRRKLAGLGKTKRNPSFGVNHFTSEN